MRDSSSPSGTAGTRRLASRVVAAFALALVPSLFVSADGSDAIPTRTFTVTASRYEFDPDRIEVQQGDHVELLLRSADTTHGLGIEAYGVEVAIPKGGEEVSVEFMAHRPGTFRIKCTEYCGSGHRRMQGRLVVAEAGQ